ncbi:MAG: CRTAC1 family protein [Vicinamibacterales bacterium]
MHRGTAVAAVVTALAGTMAVRGAADETPFAFEPLRADLFAAGANLVNAFADVDGDGDADLFVGFDGAANRLYRNDGGTFADVASAAGVADARPTRAAAFGDVDADGDPDLLLGFTPGGAGPVLRLYRNDEARFTDQTAAAGLVVEKGAVRQLAWVDSDGDGDLDLFVGFRDRPNALYRNDGGRFEDVAAEVGLADPRRTVGAVWFDVDADGDLDVAVANMDGDANGLYRNDAGRFTDVAEAAGVAWGGRRPRDPGNGTVRVCAADMDNDGRLDLLAANYGALGYFRNLGDGRFEDQAAAAGLAVDSRYDACAPADVDHDGRQDLYVNGTVTGGASWQDFLFRNTAAGFVDATPANLRALQADHGVQWADVDADGDLDLALTGSRADGMHYLMRNLLPPAAAARSLHVRALDAAGHATLAGAEVRVFAAGGARLLGLRLVDAGSGYDAQSDLPVHVGLPAGTARVDVQLTVPRGGRRIVTWRRGIDPKAWVGRAVEVRSGR